MRTWLAKFRISMAVDAGGQRREKLSFGKAASEEIIQCEASMQSLDRRLKAAQPVKPVPAGLHASVMRAVSAAAKSQERQSAPWMLRWLPVPALALLVVVGLWWRPGQPPRESSSLTVAATVLEQGHQMAQQAPDTVLSPLTQEMDNLNRDFQNAVQFLAASIP